MKKATEALVREAQKVKGSVEEDTSVPVTKKMVSDMAQVAWLCRSLRVLLQCCYLLFY